MIYLNIHINHRNYIMQTLKEIATNVPRKKSSQISVKFVQKIGNYKGVSILYVIKKGNLVKQRLAKSTLQLSNIKNPDHFMDCC